MRSWRSARSAVRASAVGPVPAPGAAARSRTGRTPLRTPPTWPRREDCSLGSGGALRGSRGWRCVRSTDRSRARHRAGPRRSWWPTPVVGARGCGAGRHSAGRRSRRRGARPGGRLGALRAGGRGHQAYASGASPPGPGQISSSARRVSDGRDRCGARSESVGCSGARSDDGGRDRRVVREPGRRDVRRPLAEFRAQGFVAFEPRPVPTAPPATPGSPPDADGYANVPVVKANRQRSSPRRPPPEPGPGTRPRRGRGAGPAVATRTTGGSSPRLGSTAVLDQSKYDSSVPRRRMSSVAQWNEPPNGA